MLGPIDPIKGQAIWEENKNKDFLFPDTRDELEATDLITDLNLKIEELEDLCGRLSFSMREIGQVLKVK